MIIYVAENLVNGKKYVGMTQRTLEIRRAQHEQSARYDSSCLLARAIRKYGAASFSWTVIDTAETRAALQDLERRYILELGTMGDGYNMTLGGDGWSGPHAPETKLKMSGSHRKRMADPELRAHLSRKMTEFTKSNREEMSRRAKMNNRPMTEKEIAAYARRREKFKLRKRQRDGT